jgi:hypothetical protein
MGRLAATSPGVGARSPPFAFSGRQRSFVHQPGQLAIDTRHRLSGSTRAVVVEFDGVAGLGRDLGDTGAHGAGTDHRHLHIACECGHFSAP